MAEKKQAQVQVPQRLLVSVRSFLISEINRLKKTRRELEKADPFKDEARLVQNSLEDDVDEQLGHDDKQVKVKFLSRQIVQMRKALTRLRIGKYGICERCGRMIDTDRLAVRPESTLCITCSKELDD